MLETLLKMLKAASDRSRLRIIAALFQYEELCSCQLVSLIGSSGATVSRHLSLLVRSGLLTSRKEGRWVFFKLNDDALLPIELWMNNHLKDDPTIVADRKQLAGILATDRTELCRAQRGERCCPT